MPAIEVRGLRKAYGGKDALRDVRLEVPRGAIHGFLGPNGAGKTTTLKVLLGLLRADAGEVRVLDEPPGSLAARQRLGFMPELPRYPPYLKAREVLRLHAKLHGFPPTSREARIGEVLAQVGIAGAAGPIKTFSKGMQQRLGLAAALLPEPDLVLLDEPTSGLDPVGRKEVRDLLAALPAQGTTVFLSSHVLAEVETLCDRVSIIHQGKVRAQGSTREVVARFSGAGLLEVELAQPHPGARAAVEALPFVAEVEGDARRWRARLREGRDHRAEVSRAITGAGGVIVAMGWSKGGLEEAFLRLVEAEA